MTTPSLFALNPAPAGIKPPTGRNDRGDAEAGELWTMVAEASSDGLQAEDTANTDATTTSEAAASRPAPFDLPAFLQVLPKAATPVAAAAAAAAAGGRDRSMAEAVRRLPVREMPDVAAVSSHPVALHQGASPRLPTFLVAPTEPAGTKSAVALGAMPEGIPREGVPREGAPKAVVPTDAVTATVVAPAVVAPAVVAPAVVPDAVARTEVQLGAVAALRAALQSMWGTRPTVEVAATGATVSGKVARAVAAAGSAGEGAPIVGDTDRISAVVASAPPIGRGSDARGVEPRHAAERRTAEPRQPKVSASAAAASTLAAMTQSAIGPAIGPANAPTPQSATMPSRSSSSTDVAGLAALSATPLTAASHPSSAAADIGTADGLLRSPVGSEGWQEELGAQLTVMLAPGGESEAVMKLAPEELGELEIRVQIRDGEASVQFGAVNAEARQAIEAAQPRLREMFASQGMEVSNFSIYNSLSGNPQSSSKQGEGSPRAPRSDALAHDGIEVRVTGRQSQGIVDLYA